jgi:hypothetical protein
MSFPNSPPTIVSGPHISKSPNGPYLTVNTATHGISGVANGTRLQMTGSFTSSMGYPTKSSDYPGLPHMTSMDDLVSESGLDDTLSQSKRKMKYYNKALISYLSQQGLNMNPLKLTTRHLKEKNLINNTSSSNFMPPINTSLSTNSNIETFITGNGQLLFLPFNPQKKQRRRNNIRDEYNDEENDGDHDNEQEGDHDNSNNNETENDNYNDDNEPVNAEADEPYDPIDLTNISNLNELKNTRNKGNAIEGIHNITYHTFGIIIKMKKSCTLNEIIKVNYHTHSSVRWIAPEYSKKSSFDERYRTSEMINWDLDLSNPDCYIPLKDFKSLNDESNDLNDDINTFSDSLESDSLSMDSLSSPKKKINDVKYSDEPTQNIKRYTPLNPKDYVPESNLLNDESMVESNLFKYSYDQAVDTSKSFDSGYYIFLLPVVFPLNTPESILLPNGNHLHDISIQIQKGTISAPSLQVPQSAFLSTSPAHHYKYDDQNFEFHNQVLSNSVNSNGFTGDNSNLSNSKSSFFKKIGLRRNSSSNKSESSILKFPTVPSISNFGHEVRSTANHFTHSNNLLFNNNHNPSTTVYNYSYKLPAVRLPPSDATSTLNKSIYVNKIWNKALNYELLLPKKFTQLSPPNKLKISPNDKFLRKNTFLLQMKLVPLVKNLQLKRIKINILEKTTYIAKGSGDLTNIESKNLRSRTKERTVTMMEIKTKEKNTNLNVNSPLTPLKTQIIKGCTNDNLLTFCYNNESSSIFKPNENPVRSHTRNRSRSDSTGFKSPTSLLHGPRRMARFLDHSTNTSSPTTNGATNDVIITNPVKLQCPLDFIANDDSRFISKVYENLCTGTSDLNCLHDLDVSDRNLNDTMSIFSVNSNGNEKNEVFSDDDVGSSKSPARRPRNFSFSSLNNNSTINNNNNNNNNSWHSITNDDKSAVHTFLPDVTSPNMKVRHRLQISFRISRPDPKIKNSDGEFKLHHYEVIVDTPIVFVSPFCVTETLDLPSYEDAIKLGMFEVEKNSSNFAIAAANMEEAESFYDYENVNDENHAVFMPCSPLMSGTTSTNFNYSANLMQQNITNNSDSGSTTRQISGSLTSQLSLSPSRSNDNNVSTMLNRMRSDSGHLSINAGSLINTSSKLSAAFSRSKESSTGLHSALNDMNTLSLSNGRSQVNTIDHIINCHGEHSPPVYTEIGFKTPTNIINSSIESSMVSSSNDHPPTYEVATKEEPESKPDVSETSLKRIGSRDTMYTIQSERLGLLNNNSRDGSYLSIYNKENFADKSIDSDISNIDENDDIDSIVNLDLDQIATLNLTPTQNGI